ncbi:MAG TPA: glutamate racemase [Ktedonobacteraceae bacterium]|nr:glutamate racemase [Ktedonobacteraceae bacterium]
MNVFYNYEKVESAGRAQAPIGVFDSGAGGLTILSALQKELPYENYTYFGDTAYCPYGMRSASEIVELSIRANRFLIERGVKLIVVACNTVSLVALDRLGSTFSVPFVGVIPAVKLAAQTTKKGRIGVAATYLAAKSTYLRRLIDEFAEGIQVYTIGCPELVTLVESCELDGPVVEQAVRHAMQPLLEEDVDVIVLGCTHFPALRPIIEHVSGHHVQVIDSTLAVVHYAQLVLDTEALIYPVSPDQTNCGEIEVWCSGDPIAFSKVASKLLGYTVFAHQTQPERVLSETILVE